MSDTGAEVGIEPGPFSFSLSVTNGATADALKFAGYGYFISDYGLLGLSASSEHDTATNLRRVKNIFGGIHLGRFSLLGEVDRITDSDTEIEQEAALIEMNYLIAKGANLKITFEYLKPDLTQPAINQDRLSVVYEPFVNQFLQIRLGARNRRGPKQDPALNANLFFLEIHVIF